MTSVTAAEMIRCPAAVDLFEKHLALLPHPDRPVKFVQFTHDSEGIRRLRQHIAEGLTLLVESCPQVLRQFAMLYNLEYADEG